MNLELSRWFRILAVGLLFELCGAWSAKVLLPGFPSCYGGFLFPLPFALLCVLMFMHNRKAVFSVLLMLFVWHISFAFGCFSYGLLGGVLGGLGLTLAASISCRPLRNQRVLALGTILGSVAGFLFLPFGRSFSLAAAAPEVPVSAFALWDLAMGVFLYLVSSHAGKRRAEVQSAAPQDGPLQPAGTPALSAVHLSAMLGSLVLFTCLSMVILSPAFWMLVLNR